MNAEHCQVLCQNCGNHTCFRKPNHMLEAHMCFGCDRAKVDGIKYFRQELLKKIDGEIHKLPQNPENDLYIEGLQKAKELIEN